MWGRLPACQSQPCLRPKGRQDGLPQVVTGPAAVSLSHAALDVKSCGRHGPTARPAGEGCRWFFGHHFGDFPRFSYPPRSTSVFEADPHERAAILSPPSGGFFLVNSFVFFRILPGPYLSSANKTTRAAAHNLRGGCRTEYVFCPIRPRKKRHKMRASVHRMPDVSAPRDRSLLPR